jgi:hypothetical protein
MILAFFGASYSHKSVLTIRRTPTPSYDRATENYKGMGRNFVYLYSAAPASIWFQRVSVLATLRAFDLVLTLKQDTDILSLHQIQRRRIVL